MIETDSNPRFQIQKGHTGGHTVAYTVAYAVAYTVGRYREEQICSHFGAL